MAISKQTYCESGIQNCADTFAVRKSRLAVDDNVKIFLIEFDSAITLPIPFF